MQNTPHKSDNYHHSLVGPIYCKINYHNMYSSFNQKPAIL